MDEEIGPRRGHLRSKLWVPVSHGLYRPRRDVDGPLQDLGAWQLVLPPGGALTHLTAAAAYGWWLPPLPDDVPVFAAVPHSGSRPRRPGLTVVRHTQAFAVSEHNGLLLTTPAETLLSCAADLDLLDVVVLADAALHLGACTLAELDEVSALRRRGAPMLRRARAHVDGRSESAWETLLRVLHAVCGVPVEPQYVLEDEHGSFVARADLRIVGTTTIHEYDGGEHRKKARHRKDLARERRIGNVVWTRRGYTDVEVLHQAMTILRDADRSLGRPHRPERIRAWHALLARSLFTPSGTERLRRRWGLPPSETGQILHGSTPRECSS